MGDNDNGAAEGSQAVEHFSLRGGIKGRGALVEQQHGCAGVNGAGTGKALYLALGKPRPFFAKRRVDAVWQRFHKSIGAGASAKRFSSAGFPVGLSLLVLTISPVHRPARS